MLTVSLSSVAVLLDPPGSTLPALWLGGVAVSHFTEYSMLGCQGVYHSVSVLLTCLFPIDERDSKHHCTPQL